MSATNVITLLLWKENIFYVLGGETARGVLMAYELWLLTLTLSYDFWVQAPNKWAKQLSKCLLWPNDGGSAFVYNLLSGKLTTHIHIFINH